MWRVWRGSMMPSSHRRAVPKSAVLSASRRSLVVGRQAQLAELVAVDDVHHLGRLRAPHHGGARAGPGEDEARVETAPAHAVVAGAETAAQHDGELGAACIRHGLDHLGAVLDGAGLLGGLAHHVAGGVLQEDQRRAALVTGLDELRGLGAAGRLDGAVVADQTHRVAVQARVAADGVGRQAGLEFEEVAAVHQPRDDLAHVVGLTLVGGHHAQQFFGRVQGLKRCAGRWHQVPGQLVEEVAHQGYRMGVVVGQVLTQTGDLCMHLCAAQFFVAGVFTDGGLHQRRAGQVDAAASLHQHHVVAQARQVGAAGGGRAVHHRDLRDAGGRQARLVREAAPAVDKDLGLVHQVGAAAFHQGDQRQLVLACQFLRAQGLLQAHGRDGAALHRAVAGAHHNAFAGDHADADDAAAALHAFFAVVVVHAQPGQRAELEEVAAGVDEARHAFTRQELAAGFEPAAFAFALRHHSGLQRQHFGQALLHALDIGREAGRAGVEA